MKGKVTVQTMKKRITLLAMLLFACFVMCAGTTQADDNFPSKAIKLIVPWSPGGGSDAMMRIAAETATKIFGEPVVVVNVPGVGGTRGFAQALKAKPDGYTLVMLHESTICTNLTGLSEHNFHSVEPIANLTNTPDIMAVGPNAPWKTLREVMTDAEKNPNTIKLGVGLGSSTHFAIINMIKHFGNGTGKFKLVSYQGTAKRQAALAGGYVDFICSDMPSGKSYFDAGKFVPLAIGTAERHPMMPNVPTYKEEGVNLQQGINRAIFALKGTPVDVLKKLEDGFLKVANDPKFKKRVEALGSDVEFKDAAATQKYFLDLQTEYKGIFTIIKEQSKANQ